MLKPEDIESKVMVAISLSFPDFDKMGTKNLDATVVYRLNKVAFRELFGIEEDEENSDDAD